MAARIISYYCSSLDSLWPPVLQSWVLCFPQASGTTPQSTARILRLGLERTIKQRPYLAGIVSRDPQRERLMVTYPIQQEKPNIHKFFGVKELDPGLRLHTTNNDARPHSYHELRQRQMPISQLLRGQLEPYGGSQTELNSMPVVAQANFIPGGCLLSVTLHHSIFDGFGAESVVAAWARNCKELQQHGNSYYPEEDIHILTMAPCLKEPSQAITNHFFNKSCRKDQPLTQDNYMWELLGMQNPHTQISKSPPALYARHYPQPQPPSQPPLTPAIFTASANSIARLKANSTPPPWALAGGSWPEISTFDAVASLLWRSIMAARLPDLDTATRRQKSRLRIPVSIRKSLKIPPNYPGNCLLNAVTSLPVNELVSEPDGERTSPMIRAAILTARSPTNASNAIRLSQATSSSISTFFRGDTSTDSIMPPMGNRFPVFKNSNGAYGPDLVLTSWRDLGYYRHDWGPMFAPEGRGGVGIGRPEFVRVPTDYLPGVCILLPSRDCELGCNAKEPIDREGPPLDVLVTMPRAQLDRLARDREFGEYFSVLAM
ncbi:hypothetical protein V8F20_001423 [Naviculisporaceae sp. PSN 640]